MIPLQQTQELSCYTGGNDMLTCALSDLSASVGGDGVFGVLVAGCMLLAFYIASDGGLATPGVLTALLGGIMMEPLPGQHEAIAMTIVLIGLTAALMSGANKYVMNPGV